MPITISKAFSGGGFGLTSTWTKDIVTDGLVLYYNPAFSLSYPGSGTSLYNLNPNGNTAELLNGTTVTTGSIKALSFDGSNDYALLTPNPTQLRGDINFTICGWFKRRASVTGKVLWNFGGGSTPGSGFSPYVDSSELIILSTTDVIFYPAGATYPLNDWVFVAWQKQAGVFSRANTTIWRNLVSYTGTGLTLGFGSEGNSTNIQSTGFSIGADINGNAPASIDVATFMVYNKVLTSAEITKTYNATKTYVGL